MTVKDLLDRIKNTFCGVLCDNKGNLDDFCDSLHCLYTILWEDLGKLGIHLGNDKL